MASKRKDKPTKFAQQRREQLASVKGKLVVKDEENEPDPENQQEQVEQMGVEEQDPVGKAQQAMGINENQECPDSDMGDSGYDSSFSEE